MQMDTLARYFLKLQITWVWVKLMVDPNSKLIPRIHT